MVYKKQKRNIRSYISSKGGFAVLYSVLISSLLLAIGLAIFNITIKEFVLSAASRDSQFAFYAADTGAECAIYWDIQQNAFDVSESSNISCGGKSISGVGGRGFGVPNTFTIDLSPQPYCAIVTVIKENNPRRTIVESRGYNTCDTGNPRRVERAVRATY